VLIPRARINTWLDNLMEEGCPPWDAEGRNLPLTELGWFPEVEEMPCDSVDYGDDVEDCPW
jgi:hypothetical protein